MNQESAAEDSAAERIGGDLYTQGAIVTGSGSRGWIRGHDPSFLVLLRPEVNHSLAQSP